MGSSGGNACELVGAGWCWLPLVPWAVRSPGGVWLPVRSPAAGVNTCDIITLYISAIKALRVLDPSMVILEVACEPIRRYLR